MNEFKYALRRLYRGGSLNIIKVVSLGLGFAISFLLLSKVAYELSYDRHFKDYDRIYKIYTSARGGNFDGMEYSSVSGAVAPGMKKEIPGVEAATRWTGFTDDSNFYLEDDRPIDYTAAMLVDEHFFEVFDLEILAGDPKQILSEKLHCMISDDLAEKIGGEVIGRQFRFRSAPDVPVTISGIYRRLPANTSHSMDVLVSMSSIGSFTWDGSDNWIGNDRYAAFVKLTPGTKPEELKGDIRRMQQKYQDIDRLEKEYGSTFNYILRPIKDLHLSDGTSHTTVLLISIIGLIVLIMSLLNYLLLRISSIINSSKNTAIRKSLGAERSDIMKGIVADTLFHLFLAFLIAIFFIILFRKALGEILDVSITDVLTPLSTLIGLSLLLLSGVFISFGPGRLVAKQPIISSIRDYRKRSRLWKRGLLFIEGVGVSFLLCTVYFVQRQYDHSITMDKGFDVDNIYYISTSSMDSTAIDNSIDRLRHMPEVERASLAFTAPFFPFQSGDNLFDPESKKEIRNVSDFFWCDEHYFDLLGIPIVEGQGFDSESCHTRNVLINETFAHHLVGDFGWHDGVVGKSLIVSSHYNPVTIIGVFKDIRSCRNGRIFSKDEDIIVAGGAWSRYCEIMLLRLRDSSPATIKAVEEVVNEYSVFKDIELASAEHEVRELYKNIRHLGHYTIFGSIIAIVIAFIGIIGYTDEEVTRRRKEIAIRKVNGATFADIARLFVRLYLKVGIPATLLGLASAFLAIRRWMSTLDDQVSLSVWIFLLIGVGILLVSCIIMSIYCYFTANQNPTKYLSEE